MSSLLISFQKFKNKVPSSLLQQIRRSVLTFLCVTLGQRPIVQDVSCTFVIYVKKLMFPTLSQKPINERKFPVLHNNNSHFVNNTRNRVSSFVNFVVSLLVGLCAFLVHREHSNDVKNVQESAKQCRSMLRAFQVPLSQQESLLKQKISSIEEEEKKYQTQMEALAQKIQDTISKRKNVSLELSDLLGKKDLLERLETTLSDLEILDPSKFEELKGCLRSVGIDVDPTIPVAIWKRPNSSDSQDDKNVKVLRKLLGLLGKLTMDNFKVISPQIVQLSNENVEVLDRVINLLIQKASWEPKFSPIYAQLASLIASKRVFGCDLDQNLTFKPLLVAKCESEFASILDCNPPGKDTPGWEEMSEEEREEKNFKLRVQKFGTIKFIGELYKVKLLNRKIIDCCVSGLLTKSPNGFPSEANLECFCVLMRACGKEMDEGEESRKKMDFYFSKMKVFKRNKQFSLRLRCLMADVLDLRCAKWIPRIKTEGPTIEQIHQDAKLKKTKKETRSLSRNDRVRPFNSTKTSRSDSQKFFGISVGGWESQSMSTNKKKKGRIEGGGRRYQKTSQKDSRWGGRVGIEGNWRSKSGSSECSPKFYLDTSSTVSENVPRLDTGASVSDFRSPLSADLFKQVEDMFLEFFICGDVAEVKRCLAELNAPFPQVISMGISLALGKHKMSQRQIGMLNQLYKDLFNDQTLKKKDFLDGFVLFFEELDDLSCDLPCAPLLAGQVIGAAIFEKILDFDFVSKNTKSLQWSLMAFDLAFSSLSFILKEKGEEGEKIAQNFNFKVFVSEDDQAKPKILLSRLEKKGFLDLKEYLV